MKLRRVAVYIGSSVFAIVVAFAGVEAAFRLFPPDPPPYSGYKEMGGDCLAPHLTLGYAPIPNRCNRNEHGLMTWETPGSEPALEVLLLGDSIGERDLWLRTTLEQWTARTGRGARFANASVVGYNACQELERLRLLLPVVQPDLVVVQVCTNDLLPTHVLAPSPDGGLRYYHPQGAVDFPRQTLWSHALTWLVRRSGFLYRESPGPGYGTKDAIRCWRDMRTLAMEHGAALVASAFPALIDTGGQNVLGWDHEREESALRVALDEAGVTTLELRPGLEKQGPLVDLRLDPEDPIHPADTEAVSARIAAALDPWLAEHLPSP